MERNALRANLVERAEAWRWGSLWSRERKSSPLADGLGAWPVDRPRNWVAWVNQPQDEKELAALRGCRDRGSPYGAAGWALSTAKRLGIESSLHPRGRPAKAKVDGKGL